MNFAPPNKTSWPECVNLDANDAKAIILAQNPNLQVHLLPEGSMVTMDFRDDRVRVFHDDKNKVIGTPHNG